MKQRKSLPMRFAVAVAATALLGLVGCSEDTNAGGSSAEPSPSSADETSENATTEEPSETPTSETSSEPDPELPNIALHPNGKTPILCSEWSGLADDVQYGMVANAMVKLQLFPASATYVTPAQKIVTTDCKTEADSVAYVVAMRASMEVHP